MILDRNHRVGLQNPRQNIVFWDTIQVLHKVLCWIESISQFY
jgi:hypothetical protein